MTDSVPSGAMRTTWPFVKQAGPDSLTLKRSQCSQKLQEGSNLGSCKHLSSIMHSGQALSQLVSSLVLLLVHSRFVPKVDTSIWRFPFLRHCLCRDGHNSSSLSPSLWPCQQRVRSLGSICDQPSDEAQLVECLPNMHKPWVQPQLHRKPGMVAHAL